MLPLHRATHRRLLPHRRRKLPKPRKLIRQQKKPSGGGRCEQVESNALALAAGNLDNGLESLPEYAPMYEVTDRMDLPEVCKDEKLMI